MLVRSHASLSVRPALRPAITRALTCGVRFDGRPPPELDGRAALAMRGLPLQPHPHLRSRRSMRGTGRGGPGERARDLAAFDRARRGAHRDGAPGMNLSSSPRSILISFLPHRKITVYLMRGGVMDKLYLLLDANDS